VQGSVPTFAMAKKMDKRKQPARTTIADVKKEMDKPRLTESVRNDRRYQATLTAEKAAGPGILCLVTAKKEQYDHVNSVTRPSVLSHK